MIFREPSADAISAVSDFAKLTGDYGSLSLTDIKVLALAYMLEVEANGKSRIDTTPKQTQSGKHLFAIKQVGVFHPGASSSSLLHARVCACSRVWLCTPCELGRRRVQGPLAAECGLIAIGLGLL